MAQLSTGRAIGAERLAWAFGSGKRRTNADKRKAVETLLRDEEWSGWSNNEIARRCGVSLDLVNRVRSSLNESLSEAPERTYTNRQGEVRTMNTERIGRKPKPPADPQPFTCDDCAQKLREKLEEKAKERETAGKGQDGSGGRGNKRETLCSTEHRVSAGKTRDQLGAMFGVSGATEIPQRLLLTPRGRLWYDPRRCRLVARRPGVTTRNAKASNEHAHAAPSSGRISEAPIRHRAGSNGLRGGSLRPLVNRVMGLRAFLSAASRREKGVPHVPV